MRSVESNRTGELKVLEFISDWERFKANRLALADPARLEEGASLFEIARRESVGFLDNMPTHKRAALTAESWDAAILVIPIWPQLHLPLPHRNPLKNFFCLRDFIRYQRRVGALWKFWQRIRCRKFLFQYLDAPVLDRRWHRFAGLCDAIFIRELPKTLANTFLYSYANAVEPWRNEGRFSPLVRKLRPVTLGVPDRLFSPIPEKNTKRIDLLWAGNLRACSPVREKGIALLRSAVGSGLNIVLLDRKVPVEEYYDLVASSWLVWSPEGAGWQCYKHYEIMALGSVPVISWPTIWQHRPLENGVHCIYYNPEGEDLLRQIRGALENRERLLRMGVMARAFALRFKSESSALASAIFDFLEEERQAGEMMIQHPGFES